MNRYLHLKQINLFPSSAAKEEARTEKSEIDAAPSAASQTFPSLRLAL